MDCKRETDVVDWRDIRGNRHAFDRFVALLHTGEAIGFVGAGAGAGLYPLWPKLIEQLADAAVAADESKAALKTAWCSKDFDPLQAAQQIRDCLGEGTFGEWIRGIFGPREGTDGKPYTATHAALARLGFNAFVTTNYDPALKLACSDAGLGKLVQDFDWQHDRVGLWLQGQLSTEREFSILHAHGKHDDITSVILGAKDYRRAYGDERYQELFKQLWTCHRLAIVGFSFGDAWLKVIADQALSSVDARRISGPRHVALLGLPEEHISAAEAYRAQVEEPWHLHALFYPIVTKSDENGATYPDHSALGDVLKRLLGEVESPRAKATTKAARPKTDPDPLDVWFGQVEAEHRRLGDHFDRPAELHLIEQAWVEVKVMPAHQERRDVRSEDVGDGKLPGHPTTLDKVLDWPIGSPSRNEGRWLLEGPPGSGKTTLLRHLAARLARGKSHAAIPVFVSLPRLIETGQELLTHATDGLGLANLSPVRDALAAAGRAGRLLLLLDSFDEIPRERRAPVRRLLTQLRQDEAWSKCRLVVSSRPIGRGQALEELPRLDLLPLDFGRRQEFLETWFRYAGQPEYRSEPEWTPEAEAAQAITYLTDTRGLRDLSGIPLYLTLLAVLWEQGVQPSGRLAELYAKIFELLLDGEHRREPQPMPNQDAVREALQHLAFGMTEDDCWAEAKKKLEGRLRTAEELCDRLGLVAAWKRNLFTFLDDVHERTQILGPHDGGRGDWRFWHRTFREALAAECLKEHYAERGDGEALLEWARQLEEGGEGRWGEPLALLAGGMDHADDLLLQLGEANPKLAVRAAVFAQGLKSETVRATLNLTEGDLDERAQVFESIPDQLGDPDACLALVEQLRQKERNGFDLFWLWWIAEEAGRRWKVESRVADVLDRFFEHIPAPKGAELFQSVESKLDGRVPLWREVPEGEGWVGSPEDEKERWDWEGPRHQVRIVRPFWLGSVPVTNAQYAAFDPGKAPETWEGVEPEKLFAHPRVNVTWYEAVSFCRWLESLKEFAGCGVRLPEEEEWEYACRARTETRFWKGDEAQQLAEVGWYEDNSGNRTHQVAGKPANPWGLYDLHGNVWEWGISEWDEERYQGRSSEDAYTADPAAPAADPAASPRVWRVLRGGGYGNAALWCRSAFRVWFDPWVGWDGCGFRVLLSSAPSR